MTFVCLQTALGAPVRRWGRLVLVGLLVLGCRSTAPGSVRVDRNVITGVQIREHGFTNVFDAVQSLRSNWLLTKGPDSFRTPTEVQVYLDNVRMGGVQTLRTISTETVKWVRYYDGLAASARWGLDHGQGVVFVSTVN